MAIEWGIEPSVVGQERFHTVDRLVMREAFAIHNSLGRFCDEAVYQEALARRCRATGLDVHREVKMRVVHKSYVKPYYLDLLVERGIIYELKTVRALNGDHQKQLINYLLLANLKHGKLLNFRPTSVESHFVSTRLRRENRNIREWNEDDWHGNDQAGRRLRETLRALLEDWGGFLDVSLYRDALEQLLGGGESGVQRIEIVDRGHTVGQQEMHLLDPATAWHLSTIKVHLNEYGIHLQRLLRHTTLERLHWINLNQSTVTLKTLKNSP